MTTASSSVKETPHATRTSLQEPPPQVAVIIEQQHHAEPGRLYDLQNLMNESVRGMDLQRELASKVL